MIRKLLIFLIFPFLFFGCEKNGRVEFVQVVQDHQELSIETLNSVILSIYDDIETMRGEGVLTSDMEIEALNLIERLRMIQDQSIVISDYTFVNVVDEELLARLLRAQWRDK